MVIYHGTALCVAIALLTHRTRMLSFRARRVVAPRVGATCCLLKAAIMTYRSYVGPLAWLVSPEWDYVARIHRRGFVTLLVQTHPPTALISDSCISGVSRMARWSECHGLGGWQYFVLYGTCDLLLDIFQEVLLTSTCFQHTISNLPLNPIYA